MKILVLGGAGFLGRHVTAALLRNGHEVVVGSRRARAFVAITPAGGSPLPCARRVRFEKMTASASWDAVLADIEMVVNCVGILRPRGRATFDRVHHLAPAALAAACARLGVRRLIHVSALGLHEAARSGFIRSKVAGERALAPFAGTVIVRPSLLDGDGGFGARWIRRVARWPVHVLPRDASGRIAVLDVEDAGHAIAALCEADAPDWKEVDLGGDAAWTMAEYLAKTRAAARLPQALQLRIPGWCARWASYACDLLHATPFSLGHLELLRRDNLPRPNRLRSLLGRSPTAVAGVEATEVTPSRSVSPSAV